MEKIISCPICKKSEFQSFLNCKDYTVSNETFSLVQCKGCEFVFTNPRPELNAIGKYYESQDYVSHSDTNTGLINSLYQFVKNYTIGKKVKLVDSLSQNKAILDVGCGTGSFLGACKNAGWQVSGVEPNSTAFENCKKNFSFTPQTYFQAENYKDGSLGIITMWHVLEHVHDLDYYLSSFHKLLDNNGVLIIAVPNLTSYDAIDYKEYWAAYDVPRHLWHFSPKAISQLCSQYGFSVKRTLPMWFDSFYVSMLSEKYKNGGNILKAFLIGFVSNLKALLNPGTCSSQIYVFVKK